MRLLVTLAALAALVFTVAEPNSQLMSLQQSGYDEETSLRLLHYSYSSYCPKKMVESWKCPYCKGDLVVRNRHYNGIWRNNAAITGHSPSAREIVVAFRGTQAHSLRNWITDLTMFRTDKAFPGVKGAKVHKGFWKAYHSLKDVIIADINALLQGECQDCVVRVTGHSLGGAMATVCAADLAMNEGYRNIELLSFGMPRVGNKKFAAAVESHENLRVGRVTKGADIIVALPSRLIGFRHFPTEVYYRKSGQGGFRICNGAEDKKCLRGRRIHSLTDHLQYLGVNFLGCYLPRTDAEQLQDDDVQVQMLPGVELDYERDIRSTEPVESILQRLGLPSVSEGVDLEQLEELLRADEENADHPTDPIALWQQIVADE